MLINEREDAEGDRKITILCRRLQTKGLIIRPKAHLFAGLEQNPQEVSKILHTISHAFLVDLPLVTGLEPNEFFESIDVDRKEVAIFDNEPGGIGGVSTVVSGDELSSDYQGKVGESVDCDLDCSSACKACLYIENCGRLNRQLNRHILTDRGVIAHL